MRTFQGHRPENIRDMCNNCYVTLFQGKDCKNKNFELKNILRWVGWLVKWERVDDLTYSTFRQQTCNEKVVDKNLNRYICHERVEIENKDTFAFKAMYFYDTKKVSLCSKTKETQLTSFLAPFASMLVLAAFSEVLPPYSKLLLGNSLF